MFFRNLNSGQNIAGFLRKFLFEANASKVEQAIKKVASSYAAKSEIIAELKEAENEKESVNIGWRRAGRVYLG